MPTDGPIVVPPEPIFCRHCGQRLISDNSISEYNDQTGEPIRPFTHLKVCPQHGHSIKGLTAIQILRPKGGR